MSFLNYHHLRHFRAFATEGGTVFEAFSIGTEQCNCEA